jgi:hypothetical protein
MYLDLTKTEELTFAGVQRLIASREDSTDTQLRVTRNGLAYLASNVWVDEEEEEKLAFRLEGWFEGNGYVGKAAANDKAWVRRIFNCLKDNWSRPYAGYCDFIDEY